MGQLMINLPVTIVILITAFVAYKFGLGWSTSILVGTAVGWFVWGKLLLRWKNWALDKGVDRERLFKLGMLGLLNFTRYKIFEEEEKGKVKKW